MAYGGCRGENAGKDCTHRAWVTTDTAPVVDEAHEDEDDNHDYFDHGEPVFGFTVNPNVNKLHCEDGEDDD